jgi:TolB-like protein/DNA-binding winged helix-turn-helix (wHTH) protein/Flp pilus assembly protein TadD
MRFVFGDCELEPEARTLQQRGERIPVEPKVFDLLVYLIERRERVVSSNELLDALWPGVSVTPAALTRTVQKARQAVGDDGERQAVLRTEHGHGFRFVAEVTDVATPAAAAPVPVTSRARIAALAGLVALLVAVAIVWLQSRPVVKPAPGRSVAVLPFANLSQDAAAEPFTNGIYDDILTRISKIHGLKVIARTSMERLDPALSIREIGTKLGVAAVLEGGVQRVGDRIRINVQLNDCETEAHLWAETYDRELTAVNIFAIQSEIATSVADALKATLSPEEQDRFATAPTQNLVAYQAYLLGRQHLLGEMAAEMAAAGDYFQQAIDLDPAFALAYVGLADSYTLQTYLGGLPPDEGLVKAQAAVDKALELNDRLGEAHNSLAGIKDERGDLEGAEAAYQRALELKPNYARSYHWYGVMLREKLGRPEEALSMFLRAAELDPLSGVIMRNVAAALHTLGRFEESLTWLERSVELDPGFSGSYADIGFHHWSVSGQLDEAVVWYAKAMAIGPGEPDHPIWLGRLYLDLGDPGKAEFWIERSIELRPGRPEGKVEMSFLHLYRGDEPTAVDHARKALADFPRRSGPVLLLRNHELRAGRYAEARNLFGEIHPELLRDNPEVGRMNWGEAIDLALVLFKTGEKERADLLLNRSLQYIQTKPRLGGNGYSSLDAQIFALQGKTQKALSTLREAIDEGWRSYWWYIFEHEPNLESLRGEPEFQSMLDEVRADMAAQLEHVREMERNGELPMIPPIGISPTS